MVTRVTVTNAKPEPIPVNPGEGEGTGTVEVTVLNTHATKTVELASSAATSFGKGFPLPPGAAWSARCSPAEKLWAVAGDATAVDVAIIVVQVPA